MMLEPHLPNDTSAETDEGMETGGGGLASLGRHSDAGTPKDPAWKHALRSLILYIASLITLLVLDAIWMKGIAPALGVDYFAVVKVIGASSTPAYICSAAWLSSFLAGCARQECMRHTASLWSWLQPLQSCVLPGLLHLTHKASIRMAGCA